MYDFPEIARIGNLPMRPGLEGTDAGAVVRHDGRVWSVAFLPKVADEAAPLRALSESRDHH